MLKRFEVSNFKSFNENFIFELGNAGEYQFNKDCIQDTVVNKSVIYGANATGKSNLGLAIFDIVSHLTDNNFKKELYDNYLNASNKGEMAEFKYVFLLDGKEVEYCYGKVDVNSLVYEKLTIHNKLVLSIDRRENSELFIDLDGAESLKRDVGESNISILNYVKNSSIRSGDVFNNLFDAMLSFVKGMLFFKYLLEGTMYIGSKIGKIAIAHDIIKRGRVEDFQSFLNRAGVQCELEEIEYNGKRSLAFVFNGNKIYFWDIASTGTKSLTLLYFWLQQLKEKNLVSFVFIDEFDAFYHHELSELVVRELKTVDAQVILTTHNTSIMSNDLLRPDCYFLMKPDLIKPLNQCTDKELRLAHNLEKIYRAEGFHV